MVEIAFQYTGNNPVSSFAVPADVLNAAKAYVAAQFQADVPGGVLTSWGESYNDETGAWEPVLLAKAVPFDRVRIKSMEGPFLYTVQADGEDVVAELWKVAFEYHTTVPEFAQNLLAGGMTLDDEGWMNFTNGFNYVAVTGEEDRTMTRFLTQAEFGSVGFRNDLLDALQGAGLSSVERYENAEGLYHANGEARATNLDGDGVAERVQMCDIVAGGTPVGRRVEIWEGEKLLFSEEGYYAHAGWNALFLCTVDGEDCLLRYHPTMYQGVCSYTFELFTLSRAGEEMTVREGRVEFDINFQPMLHQNFDPEAIADFMEKVNSLLENSVQLLNTDQDLLGAFEKEGRLYDSLWWLDAFPEEGFTRDPGKSLLENLKDYQTAMEARWYAVEPEIMDMGEAGSGCLPAVGAAALPGPDGGLFRQLALPGPALCEGAGPERRRQGRDRVRIRLPELCRGARPGAACLRRPDAGGVRPVRAQGGRGGPVQMHRGGDPVLSGGPGHVWADGDQEGGGRGRQRGGTRPLQRRGRKRVLLDEHGAHRRGPP